MDVSNAPENKDVMIAFLPTTSEWCKIDLPHMTLVYAGTVDTLQPSDFNSLAKDAAALSMLTQSFTLTVRDVDVFGETDKVNVLRFRKTPELQAMRQYVKCWNKSVHEFNPHATIGPANEYVDNKPAIVNFNRIMVGWGDEQLTFWLKNAY